MIAIKFLNLLVIYSVFTKITATEKFEKASNCSLQENKNYSTELKPYITKLRKKFPHLFPLCNYTSSRNNNNHLGSVNRNRNLVNSILQRSDTTTYSTGRTIIIIPIGLIAAAIGAACKSSKSKKDRSLKVPKGKKDNFVYVPENVIPLPPPPTRQDGQTPNTDNSNGAGPLTAYTNLVIPQIPTYEEIAEKRNKKKRNKKIKH